MFAYILESHPDRAKIFPTKNYYYFSFIHHGVGYSGNIRLDAKDRDQGKLHFAYFEDFVGWRDRPTITHIVLDRADGVIVEMRRSILEVAPPPRASLFCGHVTDIIRVALRHARH